jgi:hypothetical protein
VFFPQDEQVAGNISFSENLPPELSLDGLPPAGPALFFRAIRQSLQRVGSLYSFSAKNSCSSNLKIKLFPQSLHTMVLSFLVINITSLI